jgi:uncharacterized protein (TIGR03083 family)
MDAPEDQIELVQAESERLKQYLSTLPPDAWHQPSACDRWQVRDVVAHLAGTAEFYSELISRGLQGDASPPEGAAAGTINAASIHEMNAQLAISYRESLGDQVMATFNTSNDKLNQLLAGIGPKDRNTLCYHPIGGTIPVQAFIGLRLRELAMHEWDMRSKLEPTPHLSADSLPVFMQAMPRVFRMSLCTGSRLSIPVRYRFDLIGAVPIKTDIVVEGDKARMEDAGASAHVTFGCETEIFVLLIYGRIAFDAAVSKGHISVKGDHERATQFGQWFGGKP